VRLTPALVAGQYNERYPFDFAQDRLKPSNLVWNEFAFTSVLCGSANATNLSKTKEKQMILGIDIAKDKFDVALYKGKKLIATGQ